MAEFLQPLITDINTFSNALPYVARELDLCAWLELYIIEFVAQARSEEPATPYVEMFYGIILT
jgi:hypothetical protein